MGPSARALQQEKPPQWEVYALELESSPHLLQLEKVHVQWRPKAAKNKNKLINLKNSISVPTLWTWVDQLYHFLADDLKKINYLFCALVFLFIEQG